MTVPSPSTATLSDSDPTTLPWHERAMRWAQLTLVDDDPRVGSGYDTNFWLDYFRDIQADAACLSAGGYMAFYPTEVDGHYRSKNLGDSDPFGDLVAGCRSMGLVVMARIDPHAIHDSVYQQHPEWVAVDIEGKPIPHWSAPNLWLTCPFGTYSTEFIPQVNAEIMTKYDVDAIFANRWTGTGRCYCGVCAEAFSAATGHQIPAEIEPSATEKVLPPIEKLYREWRENTLLGIARQWDDGVRAIKSHARFIPNSGGGVLSDLDMNRLAAQTETLFADKQARSGLTPAWTSGRYGKEFRAVMGPKAVGGIFSVGIEEVHRWKDSVQSAEEIRMWVASATANGMRAWWTKFGGTVPDTRWLGVVGDIYRWHADNERYLRNVSPIAEVGLVYSQQTAKMFGLQEATNVVQAPLLGYYQALLESRTLFNMVHDQRLDPEDLEGIKVLILPNIASLSDRQCEQLRAFVAAGGSIIATSQTSLFDEDGNQRGNFGLSDLFGADYGGGVRESMKNSYLELHPGEDDAERPLLEGLSGTTRIINAVNMVETVPHESSSEAPSSPLTLIDSYPDLPMEDVYRRDWSIGQPQAFLRKVGAGRVIYFPGDLDRSFLEFFTRDHYHVLVNAVRWASIDPPKIDVEGPGIYEVTGWRQERSMTVHLVNFNNPMYMKGPFHEFLPSPPVTVRAEIPEDQEVEGVRLLRAGIDARSSVKAGYLSIDVESIDDFEVIAIDLRNTAE